LARRNAAHCFMGGPKRRKQPERYVQFFGLKSVENLEKTIQIYLLTSLD
jgi:hypothetical protein